MFTGAHMLAVIRGFPLFFSFNQLVLFNQPEPQKEEGDKKAAELHVECQAPHFIPKNSGEVFEEAQEASDRWGESSEERMSEREEAHPRKPPQIAAFQRAPP